MMSNEQLAVLLSIIADEFSDALAAAELALAAQRPCVRKRVHQPAALCWKMPCDTPEHWQDVDVDAPTPELDALRALLGRLEDRIVLLRGRGG